MGAAIGKNQPFRRIVYLEGNIAAGKSTILNELQKRYPLDVNIVLEDVDDWTLLRARYQNPHRFSFSSQMQIMLSMYNTIKKSLENVPSDCYIVVERSIESTLVFAKDALENQYITVDEYTLLVNYSSLLNNMLYNEFYITPVVVYLTTPPEMCMERAIQRRRPSEKLTQDLLISLHNKFSVSCADSIRIENTVSDEAHFDQVCTTIIRAAAGATLPGNNLK